MSKHNSLFIALIGIVSVTVGCSSANHKASRGTSSNSTESGAATKSAPALPPTIQAAAEENASHIAEITFAKNSADLNQAARDQLASIADAAKLSRKIDGVKILAWADEEYPAAHARNLSKAERHLADRRAKAVKDFLASNYQVKGAETINMAKRPNPIAKLFKTDDARLKKAMETAGLRDSDAANSSLAAKASHAVVMFITE